MMIKLNDDYTLAAENSEKKLRLVVFKYGVENVCRKESRKKLEQFIQSDDQQAFKGRLQLRKVPLGINVVVKGQIIGTIKAEELIELLLWNTQKLNIL